MPSRIYFLNLPHMAIGTGANTALVPILILDFEKVDNGGEGVSKRQNAASAHS